MSRIDIYTPLLNALPDPAILTDAQGRIFHLNPAAERAYGLTLEHVHTCPLETILPYRWLEAGAAQVAAILERTGSFRGQAELTRAGARVELTLSTLKDAQGTAHLLLLRPLESSLLPSAGQQALREALWQHGGDVGLFIKPHEAGGWRIAAANPAFVRLSAYPEEALVGQNPALLLGSRSDKGVLERFRTAFAAGETLREELALYRQDGSEFWVQGQCLPGRDARGRLTHYLLVGCDVSELKRRNLALRKNEERFRLISENSLDLICLYDEGWCFTFVSPSVRPLLGYSSSDLLGLSLFSFFHPDERALQAVLEQDMAQNSGGHYLQHRFRMADGGYLWLESFAQIIFDRRGRAVLQTTSRNITARREAEGQLVAREQLLRTVLDTSPDAILLLSLEGRVRLQSAAAEALLGYAPEALAGQPLPIHPDDEGRYTSWTLQRQPGLVRVRFKHQAGYFVPTEVAYGLTHAPDGNPNGAVLVARDIRERLTLEAGLYRAKEAAEGANRAKSEFLSRMSHELRTPLNAILGFVQVMEKAATDPRQKDRLSRMKRAGRHLLDLINEVLDIAAIEEGRVTMVLAKLPLAPVLHESLGLMQPLALQKTITFHLVPSPLLERPLLLDTQRTRQVLLNLLSNAVKFSPAGERVRLELEDIGSALRLKIADRGAGISTERQAELFTPFARLGAETSGIEGSGLGLALSKGLMEAMGGRIGVRSRVGEGSVFYLDFRYAATLGDGLTPLRLFTIGKLEPALVTALEEKHLTVKTVSADMSLSGADALLLDLDTMPEALELLECLQASTLTRRLFIIVTGGEPAGEAVAQLLAAGASAYVPKPLELNRLYGLLEGLR